MNGAWVASRGISQACTAPSRHASFKEQLNANPLNVKYNATSDQLTFTCIRFPHRHLLKFECIQYSPDEVNRAFHEMWQPFEENWLIGRWCLYRCVSLIWNTAYYSQGYVTKRTLLKSQPALCYGKSRVNPPMCTYYGTLQVHSMAPRVYTRLYAGTSYGRDLSVELNPRLRVWLGKTKASTYSNVVLVLTWCCVHFQWVCPIFS